MASSPPLPHGGGGSSSSPPQSGAAILLGKQLKHMKTDRGIPGISCGAAGDNLFEWEIMLMLDEEPDSLYGGE